MNRKADYHIHTTLCRHAFGDMQYYVECAIAQGFDEIGFADHAPVDKGFDQRHRMQMAEFSEYADSIFLLREKYPCIQIRLGIEADIYHGFESSLVKLIESYPIDYVIGSVHFVGDFFVFGDDIPKLSEKEQNDLIKDYFGFIELGIRSDLIDIIGHFDVIKWTFPNMREAISREAGNVLEIIEKQNKVIELNSSGLRKQVMETYPGINILQMAADRAIPLCLGSDAHRPEEVGADFNSVMEILNMLGYQQQNLWGNGLIVFQP